MTNRYRGGFSLVELVFVIAISAIIAGTLVTLLVSQVQLTATNNRNMLAQQQTRDVMQFMTDEIQLTGANTELEPSVLIADDHRIEFAGDIDNDGDVDRVTFRLTDAGDLVRDYRRSGDDGATWSNPRTDVILQNVTRLNFVYFGEGNVAATTLADVTSVEVQLAVDTTPDETAFTAGKIREQEMVARITLRNRRL